MGNELLRVGGTPGYDGLLQIGSYSSDVFGGGMHPAISVGTAENGFLIEGYNKTGEAVIQLYADDYGNGVVGAYNRKGKGRTLTPGP